MICVIIDLVLAVEFIDTRLGPDLDDAGATARWLFHRGIRSEPTAADLAELARLQSTADHLLRTAVTGEAPARRRHRPPQRLQRRRGGRAAAELAGQRPSRACG